MTLIFTPEEMEWIDKKKFNWAVKKGCPKEIKEELQSKINQFYNGEHYAKIKDNQ